MADDNKPYISKSYLITQFKNFKKYIDGIFLPQINPSVTGNLTIDGEIIDKSGNSKIQTFENKDTLDGFSENSAGGLIWNGAPIEGGGGGASDAIDVAYDNATSELAAENVQEAIDELDKYVDDNKLDYRVEERKLIVGGGLGQKHTYSTEEQVVGTWIDGKPLYEKTVTWSGLSRVASFDIGFTDANLKNAYGFVTRADGYQTRINTAYRDIYGLQGYAVSFSEFKDGIFRVECGTDINIINAEVTVLYTKTTD